MSRALASLAGWSDTTLAGLRVLAGAFLVHASWAAMPGADRLGGIGRGLTRLDLPAAATLPPFLATVQFLTGALLVLGLLTRWAGVALALLITVLLIRSGLADPLGAGWARLVLLMLGLHFAAAGPGAYALDGLFGRRSGGSKRR